jgi:DNA end-binding protein Ku
MPRAYRKFSLTFGLVTVPVAIGSMTADNGVHGKTVCARHRGPVKRLWGCPDCAEGVAEETALAYPHDGELVHVDEADIRGLAAESDGAVSLDRFVPATSIDPLYLESAYLIWPDGKGAATGFDVLARILEENELAAVGTVVLTKREQVAVLRFSAATGTLVLHLCRFHADIRWTDAQAVRLDQAERPVPAAELMDAARDLIRAMATDAPDLSSLEDTYSERLRELVATTAKGQRPKRRLKKEAAPPADILVALRASQATAKKQPATA